MSKIIKFGEDVEGYSIPVLNEREIRAGAGILFVLMFVAILLAILKGDFLLLKYAVTFFLVDILIRVMINPRFAPTLIMGRLIVRKQTPEYVGAQQKKFAWVIGIILALTMFVLTTVMNTYSPITGLICMICLIFLFFETSFGICIGCKVYGLFYRGKAQYCPGEICDMKTRQNIQKTSWVQVLIVLAFIAFIVATVMLFNDTLNVAPHNLFNPSEGLPTE
ncbi:DUF4395 domain-containing protein [Carboxylicivirga sp. N1Y90]|uniref:DUF4395 domain-containing protein n=1 Tax=Carboxylicivirga fragile TaxID=3417571 RepID=UPI003D328586|nr:DUF4395 domain-containing protein [Marinilabiliaceae bacterium N1Y90]